MKQNNKAEDNRFSLLFKMSIFIIVVWVLSGLGTYFLIDTWGDRGTFGDMFGAVNALFSGLAFAGLLYTIILQREEIKLNREEITQNRKELKKSTIAQQQSETSLKEQVKQTHLTAKINAMSTVINYYNLQIANDKNSTELIEKARLKRRMLIKQMDDLIDGMQDSEVD